MNKPLVLCLLVACLILVPALGKKQTQLFFHDFEVDTYAANWSELPIGGPWERGDQRSCNNAGGASGSYSAEWEGVAAELTLTYKTNFSLRSNYSYCNLSSQIYIEAGFDDNEFVCMDWSYNNGNSWNDAAGPGTKYCLEGGNQTEDTWTRIKYNFKANTSQARMRFRATSDGSAEDANVDAINLSCTNFEPTWTKNLNASPYTVNYLKNTTFNATATDPESNQYKLTVCRTNSITNGYPGTCAEGQTACTSTATSTGQPAKCSYNMSNTDFIGAITPFYGFICDSNSQTCNANSKSVNIVVPVILGTLNVTLRWPNTTLARPKFSLFDINATVTCIGGVGSTCGAVTATARYNLSSVVPNTKINTTKGGTPFYILSDTDTNSWVNHSYPVDNSYEDIVGTINLTNNGANFNSTVKMLGTHSLQLKTLGNEVYSKNPVHGSAGPFSFAGWWYIKSRYSNQQSVLIGDRDADARSIEILSYDLAGVESITLQVCTTTCTYNLVDIYVEHSNKWMFVGLTYNTTHFCLYSNASYLCAAKTGALDANAGNLYYGSAGGYNANYDSTGYIDELVWYNKSLTPAEMIVIYNSHQGLAFPYPTSTAGANPQTSSSMSGGEKMNVSWKVNATGTNNTMWKLNVLANSTTYGPTNVKVNYSRNATVCIGTCPTGISTSVRRVNQSVKVNTSSTKSLVITRIRVEGLRANNTNRKISSLKRSSLEPIAGLDLKVSDVGRQILQEVNSNAVTLKSYFSYRKIVEEATYNKLSNRVIVVFKTIEENMAVYDLVMKVFRRTKIILDAANLFDSTTKMLGANKILGEGVSYADGALKNIVSLRYLTQNFLFNEFFSKVSVFKRNEQDNVLFSGPEQAGYLNSQETSINKSFTNNTVIQMRSDNTYTHLSLNGSITEGLRLYYAFDAERTNKVFDNAKSYDATVSGGEYELGMIGNAYRSYGKNTSGDTSVWYTSNPIPRVNDSGTTVSLFFKKTGNNPGTSGTLFRNAVVGVPYYNIQMYIETSTSKLVCMIINDTSSTPSVTSTLVVPINTWYHATCRYNISHLQIFVNGKLNKSTTLYTKFRVTKSTAYDYFKNYNTVTGSLHRELNGSFDELMVWNRSLTPTEIGQTYNMTASRMFSKGILSTANKSFVPSNNLIEVRLGVWTPNTTKVGIRVGSFALGIWSWTAEQNLTNNTVTGKVTTTRMIIPDSTQSIRVNCTAYSDQNKFFTPLIYQNMTVAVVTPKNDFVWVLFGRRGLEPIVFNDDLSKNVFLMRLTSTFALVSDYSYKVSSMTRNVLRDFTINNLIQSIFGVVRTASSFFSFEEGLTRMISVQKLLKQSIDINNIVLVQFFGFRDVKQSFVAEEESFKTTIANRIATLEILFEDAASKAVGAQRYVLTSLETTVNEKVTQLIQFNRNMLSGITLNEKIARLGVFKKDMTEVVGVSFKELRFTIINRVASSYFNVQEFLRTLLVATRSEEEAVGLTDTDYRLLTTYRFGYQNIFYSDSFARKFVTNKKAESFMTLNDGVSRFQAALKLFSESITTQDNTGRRTYSFRRLFLVLQQNDFADDTIISFKSVFTSINLIHKGSTLYHKIVFGGQETGFFDFARRQAYFNLKTITTIETNQYLKTTLKIIKTTTTNIVNNMKLLVQGSYVRASQTSIQVGESLSKMGVFTRIQLENILLSEKVGSIKFMVRNSYETIVSNDFVSRTTKLFKYVYTTITTADTRSSWFRRVFLGGEETTFFDSLTRQAYFTLDTVTNLNTNEYLKIRLDMIRNAVSTASYNTKLLLTRIYSRSASVTGYIIDLGYKTVYYIRGVSQELFYSEKPYTLRFIMRMIFDEVTSNDVISRTSQFFRTLIQSLIHNETNEQLIDYTRRTFEAAGYNTKRIVWSLFTRQSTQQLEYEDSAVRTKFVLINIFESQRLQSFMDGWLYMHFVELNTTVTIPITDISGAGGGRSRYYIPTPEERELFDELGIKIPLFSGAYMIIPQDWFNFFSVSHDSLAQFGSYLSTESLSLLATKMFLAFKWMLSSQNFSIVLPVMLGIVLVLTIILFSRRRKEDDDRSQP